MNELAFALGAFSTLNPHYTNIFVLQKAPHFDPKESAIRSEQPLLEAGHGVSFHLYPNKKSNESTLIDKYSRINQQPRHFEIDIPKATKQTGFMPKSHCAESTAEHGRM